MGFEPAKFIGAVWSLHLDHSWFLVVSKAAPFTKVSEAAVWSRENEAKKGALESSCSRESSQMALKLHWWGAGQQQQQPAEEAAWEGLVWGNGAAVISVPRGDTVEDDVGMVSRG